MRADFGIGVYAVRGRLPGSGPGGRIGIVKLHIDPVDADRWPDVVDVFGQRASSADSCWCQRVRDPTSESTNREGLHREVRESVIPIGLLAYLEDRPDGGVTGSRALWRIVEDDEFAWWVTCVNLGHEARSRGGGRLEFRNTVTACSTCNGRKRDRLPEEAGMKLLFQPKPVFRRDRLLIAIAETGADLAELGFA